MHLIINHNPEDINQTAITLSQLIELKNYTFKMLVTKINGTLIKKDDRDKTPIHDGDQIEIIHLISGG